MILYTKNNNPIYNFTIYGERHSGTKFLQKLIHKNFNLPITWDYGWKHFFGHYTQNIISNGQNTLFIGIVRDPYNWIMAMHKKAYHVPSDISKNLHSLLFSEWRSVNKFGHEKIDYYGKYEDRNYTSGERYKNIFDLRYNKNIYLHQLMPTLNQNYILVTYNNLINNPYEIIKNIYLTYNLSENFNFFTIKPHPFHNYSIDKDIRDIINNNIIWDIENKIGFYVEN